MSEKSEKPKGRTMNEIILDMDKGSGSGSKNQVSRILDQQTELMAKQVEKSQMEQIMAETERKKIEEENRLKLARAGQMPAEPQQREAPQEAKNILDAVRIGVEVAKPQKSEGGSLGEIVKGMADMFKTGVEVGRGQAQPQQPQQNTFEMMKQYHEMFLKPVLDQLTNKDKEIMQMRMDQIEKRLTTQVSPQDYIKTIKQTSEELGLSSAGKGEIDIKLEEMRQAHDVDMAKLGFETRKWEHQKDSEGKTIEQVKDLIKTVTEGPVGEVLKSLGDAGADKIRGSGKKNSPNIVPITCPNCQGKFPANDQLTKINCPLCGAELQKATVPTPPNVQSPPATEQTQTEQKPQEPQTTQAVAPEGQAQVDEHATN